MALSEDMIGTLPREIGVYILRDAFSKIIYIGKAKDLRARLRSYLGRDDRLQSGQIAENTHKVEYILTGNEAEALLLENQLIKAHRPRYNIDLKDDKTYVRIRITTSAEWPAISVTRKVIADGSRYFGPYVSAFSTRNTISAIGRIFPIRRCKDTEFANRTRPCIYHSIGLCLAPCVHKSVRKEYDQAVQDLIAFLEGRNRDLEKVMHERMIRESENLNFEKAAKIRDQIASIRHTLVPQAVINQGRHDAHVFAAFLRRSHAQLAVLQMTKGSLTDSHNLSVKVIAEEDLMTAVMLQFYLSGNDIPQVIYTDTLPHDTRMLEDVLSRLRGGRVRITRPSKGTPQKWLAMARDNARTHSGGSGGSALEEIAKAFHLSAIPYRMECYDISNLQGESATGSRVVFVDGEPDKSLYRHYKIRSMDTPHDFAMMKEVFERRFTSDESRPDLMVIDGGKGQLGVFLKIMEELGVDRTPVVAMAKAKGGRTDRFFLPGRKDALYLKERSHALRMLQRLRDEAHRFAVKYHRQLRSKRSASAFENIPGIGPKKANALIKHTSRLADLSELTERDLEGIKGLNSTDIRNILSYLKGSR